MNNPPGLRWIFIHLQGAMEGA